VKNNGNAHIVAVALPKSLISLADVSANSVFLDSVID